MKKGDVIKVVDWEKADISPRWNNSIGVIVEEFKPRFINVRFQEENFHHYRILKKRGICLV